MLTQLFVISVLFPGASSPTTGNPHELRALALKQEELEYLSVGLGGTPAAALWDEIAGAFVLRSEQTSRPYGDYSGAQLMKTLLTRWTPAPPIGWPLGYEFGLCQALSRLTICQPRSPNCSLGLKHHLPLNSSLFLILQPLLLLAIRLSERGYTAARR